MRGSGGRRRRDRIAALVLLAPLAAHCMLGPDYARPDVELPAAFRAEARPPDPASLAERAWWEQFPDAPLQALIEDALQNSQDVRAAAARVLQAEAQLDIARADQWPTVGVRGIAIRQGAGSGTGLGLQLPRQFFVLAGSLSWSLDFWGKYRRASEAARARLLASEWGRRAVVTTLVSQLASGYFALRTLQTQLELARRTHASRRESLRLTRESERHGGASLLDVRQAEQLVHAAAVRIDELVLRSEQQENLIQTLAGHYAEPLLVRLGPWSPLSLAPEVPAGLPSSLLERRPDVQQAEHELAATSAEIGVARADYLPQISLTGIAGFASTALHSLVQSDSTTWLGFANIFEPVFTGGRRRAQVELAFARREEARAAYQRTLLQAFREVSDALAAYRQNRQRRGDQQRVLRAAAGAQRLARIRYQAGGSGYVDVLVAEVARFDAELALADAKLDELTSLVELYRALGGGWQP